MEKYEKLEKVGEGTYGKVYKAKDKATGQLVALKKARLEMDDEGIPLTALHEFSLLRMLSNSLYIVRLLCVEHVNKKGKPMLYLIFEYLDTDLKKYIDSHRKAPKPRTEEGAPPSSSATIKRRVHIREGLAAIVARRSRGAGRRGGAAAETPSPKTPGKESHCYQAPPGNRSRLVTTTVTTVAAFVEASCLKTPYEGTKVTSVEVVVDGKKGPPSLNLTSWSSPLYAGCS
nr:cell division control protein 2 homolog C [Ipomoea batatas]